MKKQDIVFNTFLTIMLVIGWSGILFISFLLYIVSDMFRFLGDGILVYATAFIYAMALILPVVFRKRASEYIPLPVSFVVSTIISVTVVGCMLLAARSYISGFSPQKWNDNERLRIYMIDDLEEEHGILGRTDREIVDLLGEPACIRDGENTEYEYYVGDSMIDAYGYQIEFENSVAINTEIVEH